MKAQECYVHSFIVLLAFETSKIHILEFQNHQLILSLLMVKIIFRFSLEYNRSRERTETSTTKVKRVVLLEFNRVHESLLSSTSFFIDNAGLVFPPYVLVIPPPIRGISQTGKHGLRLDVC